MKTLEELKEFYKSLIDKFEGYIFKCQMKN